MKILEYNLGGKADIHFDTIEDSSDDRSNRFITWLNYLSDNITGGATIFPKFNLTIWPEQSASLLFHNRLISGQIDNESYHGGCPILHGIKYITANAIAYNGGKLRYKCYSNSSQLLFNDF